MNGLPNNLYTEGAVVFNSQPATNFYLQSMAKKRAKAEAFDNYIKDFTKTINPAGMRNQDIEGWMSKAKDWQNFYTEYRDRIKNPKIDNGAAQSEYFGRYQDLLGDTQKSKNLGEISKQYVVPIATNPDKKHRLHDNAINAIHSHDISMYDENHQQLDPSILDYSAKDFDISAQKKLDDDLLKGVKMDMTIPSYTYSKDGKTIISNYHSAYSQGALRTMGDRARAIYNGDDSFQGEIENLSHQDYDRFNNVYKGVYGKDIATNEDLAAAYGLARVQRTLDAQKQSSHNPYGPADYEAQREKFWNFDKSNTQEMNNSYIDELVENQKQRAQSTSAAWGGNYGEIPADQATLLALKADKIRYNPDNNTYIPEWKEKVGKDKDGNDVFETKTGTPMTEMDYKAALGKRDIGSKYFLRPSGDKPKQQTHSSGSSNSSKKKISGF